MAEDKFNNSSGPKRFSYSGSDFNIWCYFDIDSINVDKSEVYKNEDQDIPLSFTEGNVPPLTDLDTNIIKFGELQTITSSMASSQSPVENIGSSYPADFTRGQKTYAGTMIFTVFDQEPLSALIEQGLKNTEGNDAIPGFFTIDQIPLFNIVIQGSTELPTVRGLPQSIIKVIVGAKILTHGETISIDDFFLEQTYQYTCKYITPWIKSTGPIGASLNNLRRK